MRGLMLWFTLFILLAGCAQTAAIPPTPQTSFKGWELYSWEDRGDWRFALVPGTNRLKTEKEILESPDSVLGVEALEERLTGLASGQEIFWGDCNSGAYRCPPQDVIARIQQFSSRAGLTLHLNTQP